jgi:hypothetical protein
MAAKDYVVVRFPKEVFEKAKTASRDLGNPSASWIIGRAVIEMLELAETEQGLRRVPKLVRTLDAARSEGALLPEADSRHTPAESPARAHGGHRKFVVKGARG